ncbi:MAG: sugar ABC transporter ATP-binding protein [Isosphaeraceae bacterium]|nr:sugar ABC transporter ATP-binding protein [Isosphaeraceae bacterium]
MTGPKSDVRLEMRQISKHFGGVQALRDVTFLARAGEVHALCGENGAGKSTLMKILAGAITDFDGQIFIEGRAVAFGGPRDAEDAGVRIIYQELNLVPEMTVAANIFLGRERKRGFGWLDNRTMEAEARRLFERLGAPVSPRALVGDLRIGDQQMVEIAKALAFEAAILIMDEPTSALSDAEVARLYRVINDLRQNRHTVIYISHKMNEVFTLADHVTVLRDGGFVASAPSCETEPRQVVRWMVGREIAAMHYEPHPVSERAVLEVKAVSLPSPPLSGRPALHDLSLHVHSGEVLGVAGLLGAGRTELLEALCGASPEPPRGAILLSGVPVHFRHPREAIAAGIALVTEDRKNLGLFSEMTVAENITISHVEAMSRAGVIDRAAEARAVRHAIERLAIKTAGGGALVTSLSGGNQQKCILARWLLIEPKVLLLDEPTRGIDVGAKAEIYKLIRDLVKQGMAIIMTSSELPELLTVADRIMVLCEGRKTADLSRAEANEETIMHAATQFLDRVALAS